MLALRTQDGGSFALRHLHRGPRALASVTVAPGTFGGHLPRHRLLDRRGGTPADLYCRDAHPQRSVTSSSFRGGCC